MTVDFFEYEWNNPYVRCLVQNNLNALSDRAYAFNPDIARERSYTFLNQVRLAKKLKNPRSVQQLYDSFAEEKLANLCIMAIR